MDAVDEFAAVNLDEYEEAARKELPRAVYDYYAGGAEDEIALADNRSAWARVKLRFRVLAGVGDRDLRTRVLGRDASSPLVVAPTAFQQMACPEGELATARAARGAGAAFALSSLSNVPMEEVFAEAGDPRWFQLYVYRDRELTRDLVARAEAAGAQALMLTVDSPILGRRERDVRNGFQLPPGLVIANAFAAGKGAFPDVSGSGLAAYVARQFDPTLSWDHLDWICGVTSLPVMVKGICRGDDALLAVEHGARAVIVSNHGGRQLDGAPATAEVLPEVAAMVGERAEVYVDGGIRRGGDVVKAIALGARAVLLGRPVLWGLAVGGEAGVAGVLRMLEAELADAMALCGCTRIADIDAGLLAAPGLRNARD